MVKWATSVAHFFYTDIMIYMSDTLTLEQIKMMLETAPEEAKASTAKAMLVAHSEKHDDIMKVVTELGINLNKKASYNTK